MEGGKGARPSDIVGGGREGRLLGHRILWVEGGKGARPSDIVGGGREGC